MGELLTALNGGRTPGDDELRGDVVGGDHRLRRCAVCGDAVHWRKMLSVRVDQFLEDDLGCVRRCAGTIAEVADILHGRVYRKMVYECVACVSRRLGLTRLEAHRVSTGERTDRELARTPVCVRLSPRPRRRSRAASCPASWR